LLEIIAKNTDEYVTFNKEKILEQKLQKRNSSENQEQKGDQIKQQMI